ncbi:MAG: 3-dehydroquinate synthase [Burkholderiales bacterium]|jgi:3-dehydroquinate synthase|nr:3-dehydroquinate synthase [Burkholderiales bacterium]
MSIENKTLHVALGERSYPIIIGRGCLDRIGLLLQDKLKASRARVVTNETLAPLYLARVQKALESASIASEAFILPDGEPYKNWDQLSHILTWLLETGAERNTPLLALGGGVVGDMAGLASALYQRGMPLVQLPTSLLAQVDSSVGGKTAVNHPLGKNMIGAFHQPSMVLIDIDTLKTLPEREFISGLAEVIKYGAIEDICFFEWLEQNHQRILSRETEALQHIIFESCRIKAKIVGEDERETGIRAWLNFGHTFGHVIETAQGYGVWLHGEAVAMGMGLASRLSVKERGLSEEESARLLALMQACGLPMDIPKIEADVWMRLMRHDKKTRDGQLRFVLLERLGKAVICSGVTDDAVTSLIKKSGKGSIDSATSPALAGFAQNDEVRD